MIPGIVQSQLLGAGAWPNLAGFGYSGESLDISAQDNGPQGIFFKPDGTKMYLMGTTLAAVYQYTLSTPWDLSTASYDSVSFSVAAQDSCSGLAFKSDGTKMYASGAGADAVFQYTLSTPWDLSTASYDTVSFSVAAQDVTPRSLALKPDGTKMYLIGGAGVDVLQYTLSTPWDLSTASYDTVSFSVAAQDSSPRGLFFKPDGTKMYLIGATSVSARQYTLSTPWDLSTASYDSSELSLSAQDSAPRGLFFKPDGSRVFITGNGNDSIYQYVAG